MADARFRQPPAGITVAVTDHAVQRFRQRVGSRRGGFDLRPEIASRVAEAWAADRVTTTPPPSSGDAAKGSVYVRDLVDRQVVFVCRLDRAGRELLVITLWEDERIARARVPREFTDALKVDDERKRDP